MAVLLTHEIFETTKQSDIVVIFDRKPNNAVDLLTSFILRRCSVKRQRTFVHLLCLEKKPDFWKKRLEDQLENRICFYDFWYDPFGWNDASRLIGPTEILSQITHTVRQNDCPECDQHMILFDSTSLLLLTLSANQLCLLLVDIPEQLRQIRDPPLQVSAAVLHHVDMFDTYSELALKAIASSTISVISSSLNQKNEKEFDCVVNHRPRQETDFQKIEKVIVGERYQPRYDSGGSTKPTRTAVKAEVDPTANITFNLRLTEEEKNARNKVLLPHSRGAGVIYYEPDEADDIDYEDPDE